MAQESLRFQLAFYSGFAIALLFLALHRPLYALLGLLISLLTVYRGFLRAGRRAQETEAALQDTLSQLNEGREIHARTLQAAQASTHTELESFRSLLAHQLRMPLSVVQGYADLLANDFVPEEDSRKEYLQKIAERTRYINTLLSEQLSVSCGTEEIHLLIQSIDLLPLLQQACEDMQTVAQNQGIRIQLVTAESSLWLDCVPQQLNKVIFNILENSIKYMGREGLITIRVERSETQAILILTDDGMGVEAEEVAHLFDLSYQGKNAKQGRGHGHGLYLVKRTIEAHGGEITASSSPGHGMSTRIVLPLSHESIAAKAGV